MDLIWYSWLNKFGLILYEKFDSVDLVWYNRSVNLGLVNRGWFLVRLYHLSKRKTNFAFRTIKIRPAMVEISQKNIIASHGLSGRLAGRLEKYLLKLHGLS